MARIGVEQLYSMVESAATKHALPLHLESLIPPYRVLLGDRPITKPGTAGEAAKSFVLWLDGYETGISVLKL